MSISAYIDSPQKIIEYPKKYSIRIFRAALLEKNLTNIVIQKRHALFASQNYFEKTLDLLIINTIFT